MNSSEMLRTRQIMSAPTDLHGHVINDTNIGQRGGLSGAVAHGTLDGQRLVEQVQRSSLVP